MEGNVFSLKKEPGSESCFGGSRSRSQCPSGPAVCTGLPRQPQPSLLCRPRPVQACLEVSRGLPLPFLFGVQWGAAQTPHWEGYCSLNRRKKKGRGEKHTPSQSLPPASPHCPNVTNLCQASVPPDPTLITYLLRKIFKNRHGKERQPAQRPNPSLPPLASPLPCLRGPGAGPGGAGGGWGCAGSRGLLPLRENWVNMATAAPICTRYTNASHSRLFAENLQLSNKSLRSTHKLDWPQEVMWIPSMNVNFLLWFVRSERSSEQSSP